MCDNSRECDAARRMGFGSRTGPVAALRGAGAMRSEASYAHIGTLKPKPTKKKAAKTTPEKD